MGRQVREQTEEREGALGHEGVSVVRLQAESASWWAVGTPRIAHPEAWRGPGITVLGVGDPWEATLPPPRSDTFPSSSSTSPLETRETKVRVVRDLSGGW